jgi:penicillin amidase
MKKTLLLFASAAVISCSPESPGEGLEVEGLQKNVEIIRDQWGINHIYARNQHDLFMAQGYAAARDRLFQFEIWRRQTNGTVAEILGERELARDIGTRLFMFRGDMKEEMSHYHEDGVEIIEAFTAGVNAYIDEIMKTPDRLPIEFRILGIEPQKWTPEVVVSRHQGLLLNVEKELDIGRAVSRLGVEKVKDLEWFHPKDPVLTIDPAIPREILFEDILYLYKAFRRPVSFEKDDVLPEYRDADDVASLVTLNEKSNTRWSGTGSNNWVIGGDLMEDGHTWMANDPHRVITVPSLRYMVHLQAPGWNVIGGGEPEIPGVSIGHNEYGAWGLTLFRTDCEDLYVYELNPENPDQYKYKGDWEDMTVLRETIHVKDSDPVEVELRYTRHGPVCYIDSAGYTAFAVRCGWLEPGGSPYLASLRIDQAKTWEEYRAACNYFHIPGENMVWADRKGNIGWQSVGIAPLRRNFSGLVPVPGDGRYEWDGYLPIIRKPHVYNPGEGYFSTANQSLTPDNYTEWDAIAYLWYDTYRGRRIKEVLGSGKKMNMEDMKALQTDYLSIPARILVPLLLEMPFDKDSKEREALDRLGDWDYHLDPASIPAAIYVAWEERLRKDAVARFVPQEGRGLISEIHLEKIIGWILDPGPRFGPDPAVGRDEFLRSAFIRAIGSLEERLGTDMDGWQYGQEKYKHAHIRHPLSPALKDEIRSKLDVGRMPRGGNKYTVGTTGDAYRQAKGASFRMIITTGDWDQAVGTNTPGQSGDPDSPFYSNLFEIWGRDRYFPVYYSREKIEEVTADKIILEPSGK